MDNDREKVLSLSEVYGDLLDKAIEDIPDDAESMEALHYALLARSATCIIGSPNSIEEKEHLLTVLEGLHLVTRYIGHPTIPPDTFGALAMQAMMNVVADDDLAVYRDCFLNVFRTIGRYSQSRLDYTEAELQDQQKAFLSGMPKAWSKHVRNPKNKF